MDKSSINALKTAVETLKTPDGHIDITDNGTFVYDNTFKTALETIERHIASLQHTTDKRTPCSLIDKCNYCAYMGKHQAAGPDMCDTCDDDYSNFKESIVTETEMQDLTEKFGQVLLCRGHYTAINNTLKARYSK